MKPYKEKEALYLQKQTEWKNKIKAEPNKFKRFWKRVWYLIAFPWKWIFLNIQDPITALIFVICFLLISSEVWVPYLVFFITRNAWWLGIGSACWIFWLGPGTPFLLIVIGCTASVKALFNKIKNHRKSKKCDDCDC